MLHSDEDRIIKTRTLWQQVKPWISERRPSRVRKLAWAVAWRIIVLFAIVMLCKTVIQGFERGLEERAVAAPTPAIELTIQDSVYAAIYELRLAHPDIVMAQCIEESGNFTSALFKEGHNCTGMKVPGSRPTMARGVLYGHARFGSWATCLVDYAMWQSAFARGLTRDEYFAYLDRVYAEKPGYSKRLKAIIKDRGL